MVTGNADSEGSDALGAKSAPTDTEAGTPRRHLPWLLGGVAVLIVGLGIGIGLIVAGGGDGNSKVAVNNKKLVSTSKPRHSKSTTTAAVTTTTIKGNTPVTTAASRNRVTPTTARTTVSTTPPTTEPPPTTTTLKPLGQAPPQFLSASASPGLAICATRGASASETITWATADATSVTLTYPGIFTTPPLPATGSQVALYRCGLDTTMVTLTAAGAGGSAATSLSWNYRIVDGS